MNPLLCAARSYAERGWEVFPCHGIDTHLRCGCGRADCSSPGKHPLLQHGLTEASSDPRTVDAWWKRWRHANVAIRTGAGSGLVVVDVDPPLGPDSLANLERAHAALDRRVLVGTGSGGMHVYLGHPGDGAQVRNRASSVLGHSIDIRGDGGYVIAPPSRHASGRPYHWQRDGDPAPAPSWLLDLLTAETRRPEPLDPRRIRNDRGVSAWAGAALAGEINLVQTAPEGRRNQTLNRSAFVLGQIVGGGHLDPDHVADLLGQAGLAAGLGEREVLMTVASGMSAGTRQPRHPPEREIDIRTVPLPSRLGSRSRSGAGREL